jgi:hypothetical protein
MSEKHHMDQNPDIYSLCPKPGVASGNITWGDDVASSGLVDPRWGQLAQSLAGRPGFGTNEIMLSTRVMLSQ